MYYGDTSHSAVSATDIRSFWPHRSSVATCTAICKEVSLNEKLLAAAIVGGIVLVSASSADASSKSNTNGAFSETVTYTNVGGANPISISDWASRVTMANSGCGQHLFKVNGQLQFVTGTLCPTGGSTSVAGAHPSSNYAAGNAYSNGWSSSSGYNPGSGGASVTI